MKQSRKWKVPCSWSLQFWLFRLVAYGLGQIILLLWNTFFSRVILWHSYRILGLSLYYSWILGLVLSNTWDCALTLWSLEMAWIYSPGPAEVWVKGIQIWSREMRGPVCWSSSCSSLVLMTVFARVVVSSGNTLTASDGSPDSSQKTYHYGCCSLQWMVCNQLLGDNTGRLQRKKGSGGCWSMTNNHIWFNHGVNQNTCACPKTGFLFNYY